MSEEDNKVVTLKVRVTPEFREKIVNTAKENNRSMNAEIVARLEESFPPTTYEDAHKRFINKKISNLTYIIEHLDLQISALNFLIQTNEDNEKLSRLDTIKDFLIIQKDAALKDLNKTFQSGNIEFQAIDLEIRDLLIKHLGLKKAP